MADAVRCSRAPLASALVLLAFLGACSQPPRAAPASAPAAPAPASGASATAPAPAAPVPPRVSLKTAYTTASVTVSPVWLAHEAGAFAEQGLDTELSFIGAGQAILGALSSQETPLVLAGANQVIEANLQGGQYVVLGSAMANLTTSIWVVPSIQRPEDMRGKTVGVSNFGAVTHVALKVALEHLGLVEGRDVTVIRSGGTPETVAAMQSGAIHGGSFGLPQSIMARDLGFRELIDVSTLRYEMGTSAIVSTRAYVAQHPDVAERYLKAIIKGIQLFKTNRELAVNAIMSYGRLDDRAGAEETWEYFRDKFVEDLVMSPRAIENNVKLVAEEKPEAAGAKVEQFLDSTIADRIKASGYVEQVKRGQ
jgi:NitT/TauT family transport system substrate-binding protein